MNPADNPSNPSLDTRAPDREGWGLRKILLLIVVAFGAHLGLIYFFQNKKPLEVLPVSHVPHINLTARADDLVELSDPTLFTLPGPRDFGSAVWLQRPEIPLPQFRWTESPRWLPIPDESLGATFRSYMETNTFSMLPLSFKSDPPVSQPDFAIDSGLPANSTLAFSHSLARRQLISQPALASLSLNQVVAPSRVRILVDDLGRVVSAVLIAPDSIPDSLEAAGHSDLADSNALVQVRSLRFKPASQYTFGEVIFNWHTVPVPTNNAP